MCSSWIFFLFIINKKKERKKKKNEEVEGKITRWLVFWPQKKNNILKVLWKNLTLVNHDEIEYGTVVSVLLFGVASEADVLALILEGYIQQQNRDVTILTRAHEHHTFMIDVHMGLQTLSWDDSFTKLKETKYLSIRCGEASYH